jgi:hypothetical protein
MEINNLMDLTFVGLMTVGFVNVISFFKPELDSKVKFGLSVIFAFALTFVPADMGAIILDKAKEALQAALAVSGAYKFSQKIGGK